MTIAELQVDGLLSRLATLRGLKAAVREEARELTLPLSHLAEIRDAKTRASALATLRAIQRQLDRLTEFSATYEDMRMAAGNLCLQCDVLSTWAHLSGPPGLETEARRNATRAWNIWELVSQFTA